MNETKFRYWTTWERRYLISKWGVDTCTEIAKVLGRSENSLRKYAHKNHLVSKLPHDRAEDVHAIKYLLCEGCHPREIGEKLGVSVFTIRARVRDGKRYDNFDRRLLRKNAQADRGYREGAKVSEEQWRQYKADVEKYGEAS